MQNILDLLNALQSNIAALSQQLADAQAAVDQVGKDKYAEGFAAGVASVPPVVSDKIYSQAELDAALAPLQSQVAALQSQVDGVPAQIDAAIAAFKADLKAKYEAAQAAEGQAEADFASFLA